MRIDRLSLLILTLLIGVSNMVAQSRSEAWIERNERTEWYREARFGMFIHWGIYSIPARGEWVRHHENMTLEDYQPYFEEFNPVHFDPAKWAKIAKKAGMKYAVITVKHHDGFCMWDSEYTDYKITNTPYKKDIIKQWVEAFRAEGLKVGFYYSLIDWHHPEYPNVGNHPMKGDPEWDKKDYNFDVYLDYMHNQVKELCSKYGKIDIMWFDYSFGEYAGEKWRATKLVNMVRKLQPGVIIDNRLGGDMEKEIPDPYAGDFEGPEQYVPVRPMLDDQGLPIPWELCMTLNNHWGYAANDHQYKSPTDVIRTLVNCVSKGGNLLLNVGPDALGRIPEQSVTILNEVGDWMDKNSESIYGCAMADYPRPDWGRYTQNGNTLYAHLMDQVVGQVCLEGLDGKIKKARWLHDGAELEITQFWNGTDKPFLKESDIFLNLGKPHPQTHKIPDKIDSVIKIELIE